ncbi:MAG TPA: amidohydrolase family protein [Stellaceae bacterium]|nr:amidohydrolase family protein [Stellaceae bacterium]
MSAQPHRLLIRNGTVIDGTGKPPFANGVLIIEGNEITHAGDVSAAGEQRRGDVVIDAAGKYIMPGLIDGHVHLSSHQGALPGVRYPSSPEFATLWAARAASKILHAGVTGISVPGGKHFVDVTVREAIDGGLIEGPRVFCAGRALTPFGGIFDAADPSADRAPADAVGLLCHSVEDYVRETRRQCKRGVNMIKIADSYWGDTQTVSEAEIRAVAEEAHRRNVVVSIHSRGSGSTRAAARGGVDWIFHADLAAEDDLDSVAEAQIPIMPVFTQCQIIGEQDETTGFGRIMRDRVRRQLDRSYKTIRKARERGIAILVGTDSGNAAAFAYGKYHARELEILVREIGLSPMEAIVAATSLNAKVIGLAGRVGVIGPGKLADITIWNADPLADITVLQQSDKLAAVIKDGRLIDRGAEGFRSLDSEPPRAAMIAQG